MNPILKGMKEKVAAFLKSTDQVARSNAVETIEHEAEEMENIFGVLVLGSYVGMPSPPMQISLDLMPFMEKELVLMMEKVDTATQPLSRLFSVFDLG